MSDEKLRERERIQQIRSMAEGHHAPEVVEKAIERGWSPGKTAREIIERDATARRDRLAARRADEEAIEAPDPRAGAGADGRGAHAGEGSGASVVESARKAGILKPDRPRIGRAS